MITDAFPTRRGRMEYVCTQCGARRGVEELLYTCPECGGVFLLEDLDFERMKETPAPVWRELFDARRATRNPALRGIFRFYELMAPVLEQEDIICLGEGDTPIIEAAPALRPLLDVAPRRRRGLRQSDLLRQREGKDSLHAALAEKAQSYCNNGPAHGKLTKMQADP